MKIPPVREIQALKHSFPVCELVFSCFLLTIKGKNYHTGKSEKRKRDHQDDKETRKNESSEQQKKMRTFEDDNYGLRASLIKRFMSYNSLHMSSKAFAQFRMS